MFPITREMLKASYFKSASTENRENFVFKIVELPAFGKLQYRHDSHFADFVTEKAASASGASNLPSSFTQNDVDQGTD